MVWRSARPPRWPWADSTDVPIDTAAADTVAGTVADTVALPVGAAAKPEAPRYLTRDECEALFARIVALGKGGGETFINVQSSWVGNLRWANNRIIGSGDTRDTTVRIVRSINGAIGDATTNALDTGALQSAVATAERMVQFRQENRNAMPMPGPQHYVTPSIWSDATYNLDASTRAALGARLVEPAAARGLRAAGYAQVSATTYAVLNSVGMRAYYAATGAEYSVTVRNADDSGSGWAGRTHYDWSKLNVDTLSDTALQKCVRSAHPRAVEPGRYNVIFEPQAVYDFIVRAIQVMDRYSAEMFTTPYTLRPGQSKIGVKMFDERVTIGTDPMDPECGYIPFDYEGYPYRAVNWVENGVLTALPYSKYYAITKLGQSEPLGNPGSFRMAGGLVTLDEMIASTERGLLVTRFGDVNVLDGQNLLSMATTRDGLWLVERGRITIPVKNFRCNDSPLFMLNSIEQIGPTQLVYGHPSAAVPPLKVSGFNFNSLADAV